MSQPLGPPTDRWNVNMPAVIGVVFVFLVGVIIWVVASSGSDDDDAAADDGSAADVTRPSDDPDDGSASETPSGTTTPAPMPDLTTLASTPTSAAPTTSPTPTTRPPVTTAPGAEPGAVLGDLAVPGRPMLAPLCNDSFITVLASAIGTEAAADSIAGVLEQYPGSNYLRTDQTCPSLNPDVDGEPIYVVYFGPFPFASDACTARADGTPDAYARQLSNDLGPDHGVGCPEPTATSDATDG